MLGTPQEERAPRTLVGFQLAPTVPNRMPEQPAFSIVGTVSPGALAFSGRPMLLAIGPGERFVWQVTVRLAVVRRGAGRR